MTFTSLATERLTIDPIALADSNFMLRLVNTSGWIKFIGNRNVNSDDDAKAYVQKLIENPDITYLVVRISTENTPIGIISFIKRPHLDHHDIGFAFLPEFSGAGYALEAADAVLQKLIIEGYTKILATTMPSNLKSINLLHKLGMTFEKEVVVEDRRVFVYSILS
jgi:[ribosomal protein S5]-alanine N-acetyltransferase